jgi:hypothetical protein
VLAAIVTSIRPNEAASNVTGSVALTPNNCPARTRLHCEESRDAGGHAGVMGWSRAVNVALV